MNEKYEQIVEFLQESVDAGDMDADYAQALADVAYEKYSDSEYDEDVAFEEAMDEFYESALDDFIMILEAEDTTDKAELASYASTMKEYAKTYKENLGSAKKALKNGDKKGAKKQLKDAEKALAKAKVTTMQIKQDIPDTVSKAIINGFSCAAMIAGVVAVAAGLGVAGAGAARYIKARSNDKKFVKAIGAGANDLATTGVFQANAAKPKRAALKGGAIAGLGAAGAGAAMLVNAKSGATGALGKKGILAAIDHAEKSIQKVYDAIDNAE